MRRLRTLHIYYRELKFIAKGLLSPEHPILAQIIPIRRCNLSCGYCNEYDDNSDPVPTDVMFKRLDRLAEMGTTAITISGGEPLLHPDLEEIIGRIRRHGMLAGLISNCYLLTRERILKLNEAGLEHFQVSIDNVEPDEVSKKSLRLLDKKLVWLSELAQFKVNVNSVIGSGIKNPSDALTIGRRAVELGFTSSLGIIHDGLGTLRPLKGIEREVYEEMNRLGKRCYARLNGFQANLAEGKPNQWRCRAGARYLYICEDGLVHYCSQQRGYPGIPLESYSREDLRREYSTRKACAEYCTVACVHQVSMVDGWRGPQTLGLKGAVRRETLQAIQGVYQIERSRAT